jgi:hypothetical protein
MSGSVLFTAQFWFAYFSKLSPFVGYICSKSVRSFQICLLGYFSEYPGAR